MGAIEFDGVKYQGASAHQKEWGARIIEELELQGHEVILDLGCGDGVLTKRLAEAVPGGQVLGIDASVGMLETAQKLAGGNVSFRQLDIAKMAFDQEFDLLFSNATLHWVKDHHNLLVRCRTALKPGGVLRFNFAGDGNCRNLHTTVQRAMADRAFQEHFQDFTWPWFMPRGNDYRELVKQCGFGEVRVWDENADRFFSEEAMVKWIDQPSIVPFLARIPEPKKASFRNRVVTEMVERSRQPDGTCFETFRRLNVWARTIS